MTIVDVKLGINKHPFNSQIRSFHTPNFTLGTEIDNVKVKGDVLEYLDLQLDNPYAYNYVKIFTKNGITLHPIPAYYIVDVKLISSENKVYRLYLHPDVFSIGYQVKIKKMNIVKTSMKNIFHFPLNYRPYKYRKEIIKTIHCDTSSKNMGKTNDAPFVIFSYTDSNNDGVTSINYGWFQVGQKCIVYKNNAIRDGDMPSYEDILNGEFDELIGISADRIKGMWLVKSLCMGVTYDQFAGNRAILLNVYTQMGSQKYFAKFSNSNLIAQEFTFDNPLTSDDVKTVGFIDEFESTLYTLPQGMTINKVRITLDLTPTTANLIFTFYENSHPVNPDFVIVSNDEKIGYQFIKPLTNIATSSNAWSEYNISGQRTMEIEQAYAQRDYDKRNGYMNAISSGIGGGIAGATAGPIGMGVGTVVGLGGSLIMNEINNTENARLDRMLQNAKDRYYQNQTSNIVLSSDSTLRVKIPFEIMVVYLQPYDNEKTAIEKQIKIEGYDTSIYLTNNLDPMEIIGFMRDYEGIIKCDFIEFEELQIPVKYQTELRNYFLNGFYNEKV